MQFFLLPLSVPEVKEGLRKSKKFQEKASERGGLDEAFIHTGDDHSAGIEWDLQGGSCEDNQSGRRRQLLGKASIIDLFGSIVSWRHVRQQSFDERGRDQAVYCSAKCLRCGAAELNVVRTILVGSFETACP